MIIDLKPYPAMKDSGVPWLGQVPGHWEVLPNRVLFSEVRERDCPNEPMLSVTITKGVIPQRALLADSSKKDSSNQDKANYKLVRVGDIAYNKMRAWQGAIGISDYQGIVSPAYVVQRPRGGTHSWYLHYLLRTPAFAKEAERWSYGITSDMWSLRPEHFRMIYACLPPLPEQTAIVHYLDHMDRRIRRYIRAKQKLIVLLEEQVAARVSEAMRYPTCISERLGNVAIEHIRSVERDDAEVYVALGLYNRGRGIFHKPVVLGAELGDSMFSWVETGDLVISGQFAWEGAVALASSAEDHTIVSHRYYLLRGVKGRATTPYLWALLRSDFGAMLLEQHSRGAAGRNRPLNLRTLLKEPVPVPPYDVQLGVDAFVDTIAPLRSQTALAITLCKEFRTRLIADVVTGKLDVREAAANLPDEVAEPLEEAEGLAEGDVGEVEEVEAEEVEG